MAACISSENEEKPEATIVFGQNQNLRSRARKCALDKDPHLRSSPLQGEGKKEAGFFAAVALNDTRTALKVERHALWLIRGWGAAAGVEKDPGALGGACPERSRTGSG